MKHIPTQLAAASALITYLLSANTAFAEAPAKANLGSQSAATAAMFVTGTLPGEIDPDTAQQARDTLSREVKRRQYQELKQDVFGIGSNAITISR